MGKLYSPDEMLTIISHRGDPAAFYRMIRPFIQERYLAERSSGQTHQQCLEYLLPGVAKMYGAYCKARPAQAFEWIEQHTQGTARMAGGTQHEEVVLEMIDSAGLDDFDRKAQISVLQQYHLMFSQKKLNERGFRRHTRLLIWGGGILALIAILVSAGLLLMPLSLSISIQGRHISLSKPPRQELAPAPTNSAAPQPPVVDTLQRKAPLEKTTAVARTPERTAPQPSADIVPRRAQPILPAPAVPAENIVPKPALAAGGNRVQSDTPPSTVTSTPNAPNPSTAQPAYRPTAPAQPSTVPSTISTSPAAQ
jgi:hypothetical protein